MSAVRLQLRQFKMGIQVPWVILQDCQQSTPGIFDLSLNLVEPRQIEPCGDYAIVRCQDLLINLSRAHQVARQASGNPKKIQGGQVCRLVSGYCRQHLDRRLYLMLLEVHDGQGHPRSAPPRLTCIGLLQLCDPQVRLSVSNQADPKICSDVRRRAAAQVRGHLQQ